MHALIFSLLFTGSVFALSDTGITSSIKEKLSSNPTLKDTSITVKTNQGNVILEGTVDSETQAGLATELAQSVIDVKDVDTSKLNVKSSNQPFTDSYITAKIKGKLIQQKLFTEKDIAAMSIKVETNNGVVTLSGTADDKKQIDNAIKIARSVSGVKEVKYTVAVEASKQ